jgi:hypothetical protein
MASRLPFTGVGDGCDVELMRIVDQASVGFAVRSSDNFRFNDRRVDERASSTTQMLDGTTSRALALDSELAALRDENAALKAALERGELPDSTEHRGAATQDHDGSSNAPPSGSASRPIVTRSRTTSMKLRARARTRLLGHDIGNFRKSETPDVLQSRCRICSKPVFLNLQLIPQETALSGDALEMLCGK